MSAFTRHCNLIYYFREINRIFSFFLLRIVFAPVCSLEFNQQKQVKEAHYRALT